MQKKAAKKIVSVLLAISLLSGEVYAAYPESNLAPPVRTIQKDFKELFTAVAICRSLEEAGNISGFSTLEDINSALKEIEKDYKNIDITVLHNEVIIDIPSDGIAVRYFDPSSAYVITPFSDVTKLRTSIISNKLYRQIIYKNKKIPHRGSGPVNEGTSRPVPIETFNMARDLRFYDWMMDGLLDKGVSGVIEEYVSRNNMRGKKTNYLDSAGGIGCAATEAAYLFGRKGLSSYVVDINEWEVSDILPQIAEEQKEKWQRRGIPNLFSKRFTFKKGDIATTTFSEKMDVITCMAALQFVDDPLKVVENLYNQLNEGGVLIAALRLAPEDNSIPEFYHTVFKLLKSNGHTVKWKIEEVGEEEKEILFAFYIVKQDKKDININLVPEKISEWEKLERGLTTKKVYYDLTKGLTPVEFKNSRVAANLEVNTSAEEGVLIESRSGKVVDAKKIINTGSFTMNRVIDRIMELDRKTFYPEEKKRQWNRKWKPIWKERLNSDENEILLLVEGDKITGFTHFAVRGDEAELDRVAIDEGVRNGGRGTLFADAKYMYLRRKGIKTARFTSTIGPGGAFDFHKEYLDSRHARYIIGKRVEDGFPFEVDVDSMIFPYNDKKPSKAERKYMISRTISLYDSWKKKCVKNVPLLGDVLREKVEENYISGKKTRYLDVAGGVGCAATEAAIRYKNKGLESFVTDQTEWKPEDLRDEEIAKVKSAEEKEGIGGDLLSQQFTFFEGNAEAVNIPEKMDVISLFSALPFMGDPLKAVVNMYNSLAPGGVFLTSYSVAIDQKKAMDFFISFLDEMRSMGIEVKYYVETLDEEKHGMKGFIFTELAIVKKDDRDLKLNVVPREMKIFETWNDLDEQAVFYESPSGRPAVEFKEDQTDEADALSDVRKSWEKVHIKSVGYREDFVTFSKKTFEWWFGDDKELWERMVESKWIRPISINSIIISNKAFRRGRKPAFRNFSQECKVRLFFAFIKGKKRVKAVLEKIRDFIINIIRRFITHKFDTRLYSIYRDLRSYDTWAKNDLPADESLKRGLRGVFERFLADKKEVIYLDACGGLGCAATEVSNKYGIRGVNTYMADLVEWGRKDIPFSQRENIIERGKSRGVADILSRDFNFVKGDITDMRFPRKMDIITSVAGLLYLDDPLKGLANLYNNLEEGGVLLADYRISGKHADKLVHIYDLLEALANMGISVKCKTSFYDTGNMSKGENDFYIVGMMIEKKDGKNITVNASPASVDNYEIGGVNWDGDGQRITGKAVSYRYPEGVPLAEFENSEITDMPSIYERQFTEADKLHMEKLLEYVDEKIKAGELDPNLPVAASIVDKEGNIIVTSTRVKYKEKTKYGVNALHGEISAIREAEKLGFHDWENATLYVTLEPCTRCARAITEFYGFGRVVYGIRDPNLSGIDRNQRGYIENKVTVVECDDPGITGTLARYFPISLIRPATAEDFLATEQDVRKGYRDYYMSEHGEDIQVIVFDADLWVRRGNNIWIDWGTPQKEERFMFRHMEWLRQDLNPAKKYAVLLVGEDENKRRAKERILNDELFPEENIVFYDRDVARSEIFLSRDEEEEEWGISREEAPRSGDVLKVWIDREMSGLAAAVNSSVVGNYRFDSNRYYYSRYGPDKDMEYSVDAEKYGGSDCHGLPCVFQKKMYDVILSGNFGRIKTSDVNVLKALDEDARYEVEVSLGGFKFRVEGYVIGAISYDQNALTAEESSFRRFEHLQNMTKIIYPDGEERIFINGQGGFPPVTLRPGEKVTYKEFPARWYEYLTPDKVDEYIDKKAKWIGKADKELLHAVREKGLGLYIGTERGGETPWLWFIYIDQPVDKKYFASDEELNWKRKFMGQYKALGQTIIKRDKKGNPEASVEIDIRSKREVERDIAEAEEEEKKDISELVVKLKIFGEAGKEKRVLTKDGLVLVRNELKSGREELYSDNAGFFLECGRVLGLVTDDQMGEKAKESEFFKRLEALLDDEARGDFIRIAKNAVGPDHEAEILSYMDKTFPYVAENIMNNGSDVLLRIPVEAIEHIHPSVIEKFINSLQRTSDIYVELYLSSGIEPVGDEIYGKLGVVRKALPEGFRMKRTNTITLMPAFKTEKLKEIDIRTRLGNLNLDINNTIIIPVGFQHDASGVLRGAVTGMQILDIARSIEEKPVLARDRTFLDSVHVRMLSVLKGITNTDDGSLAGLTPEALVAFAEGRNINDIVNTVNMFIKLLPAEPFDIQQLRTIYDHAEKLLTAA